MRYQNFDDYDFSSPLTANSLILCPDCEEYSICTEWKEGEGRQQPACQILITYHPSIIDKWIIEQGLEAASDKIAQTFADALNEMKEQ